MQGACKAPFSAHWIETEYGLSDGALAVTRLERYCALLHKWQRAKNLVSRETLDVFWSRHVLDSLQLVPLIPHDAQHVMDLGSGGGFPAIPVAIGVAGRGPRITLIEANGRKCSFLKTVARELDLPLSVHNQRIERIDSRETGEADVITARALAPLPKLIGLARPLCAAHGVMLFPKGREYVEELRAADAEWTLDVVKHSSVTDGNSAILEIRQAWPSEASKTVE